jgi:hypothetical protein
MTHAMPDPEAAIRRALQAAAGELEPRDDGLQRIQRRLRRPRPLPVAWLEVAWVRLSLRLPDRAWGALDWLAVELRAVSRHFMPPSADRDGTRGGRPWLAWARPVVAMGIAVSIVTAVVYMAIEVPQAIVSTTGNSSSVTGGQTHPGGGTPNGQGKSGPSGGPGSASSGASGNPSSTPSCGSKPTPVPTLFVPSPSASPSTSASPSPSTSVTGSPSPSPSGSITPTPGVTTSTPADSGTTPGSSSSSDSQSASDAAARHQALVHDATSLTSSPCPSASSGKKTSSHKVSPDAPDPAAAGPLTLSAQETAAVWVVSAARAKVESA